MSVTAHAGPIQLRRAPGGRPRIVGHRGASGYAPENTLPSFALALAQGADILECDVHLSRDDHLIVIHDATVDRTTDGSGRVRDLTLAELKALDAGAHHGPEYRGTRLPTLDELLEWARPRCPLAIELKQPDERYPGYAEHTVRAIRRHAMERQVIIISFDHPLLAEVKALDPAIATGIIYASALPDPVAAARAVGADAIHPFALLVDRALVEAAHAAGYAVSPWTLDPELLIDQVIYTGTTSTLTTEAAELAALKVREVLAAGVDSAATNSPDRLRRLIDELFSEGAAPPPA